MSNKLLFYLIIPALCAMTILAFNQQLAAALLDKLSGLLTLESFEGDKFPPDGWKKITEFKGIGWSQGRSGETVIGMEFFGPVTALPGAGDRFAYASWATGDADTNFTTDQKTDQWLITPQITKIESGDSLKFWLRTFGEFDEKLDILISTTDADSVQSFDTTIVSLDFDASSDTTWQPHAIDLSGFAGKDIYIAFREHISGTFVQGDAVLLDLVEVTSLVTAIDESRPQPERFSLAQNFPNPFNPTTNIRFTLQEAARVTLKVYNVTGQEVATLVNGETLPAGTHTFQFNAGNLPNGVYYYRIDAGGFSDVQKMTLLK